jgi:(R,R)-butanediol dehydrogenase / meso-butanediol dehydrogenase / diacetyl reductase
MCRTPTPPPGRSSSRWTRAACAVRTCTPIADGRARDGQILGHEFAGRIAELGPGATRWRAGQAVAVSPLGSCGRCRPCQRGLPFRCAAVPNLGVSAPGAYAEYVAVPHSQLVALPAGLPVEMGAHAEPLAVALAAVTMTGVGPGDAVLVYGAGPIGRPGAAAPRVDPGHGYGGWWHVMGPRNCSTLPATATGRPISRSLPGCAACAG